jgi:hypothetical protein
LRQNINGIASGVAVFGVVAMSGHSEKIKLDRFINHQRGERRGGRKRQFFLTRGAIVDSSEKSLLNEKEKELLASTSVSRGRCHRSGVQWRKPQDGARLGRDLKSVGSVLAEASREERQGEKAFRGANVRSLEGELLAQAKGASRVLRKRAVLKDGQTTEVEVL